MQHSILPQLIGAIGARDFTATAAHALGRFLDFDLAAVIAHRPARRPTVLFDNFDRVGCRGGLANYVGFTHRINPMLAPVPVTGACRARDFASRTVDAVVGSHVVAEAEEELGFRTVGWPRRMEEIGLYIEACGGVVELGFYRSRRRSRVSATKLRTLNDLSAPVAAAFERHRTLTLQNTSASLSVLSAREREVCALLLAGCSSPAIALRLDISRYTVKDHRKAIFRKLRVGSLAELFALRLPMS
jgi:DNA-binding CsgD family transcriptional regulator